MNQGPDQSVGTARRWPCRCAPGFTLIESLIACVVLALAVGSLTDAILAGQMAGYRAVSQSRGVALGQAMMQEVLSHPYTDPAGAATAGPEAGETRATFNCMDDYNGFEQSPGHLTDAAGQAYPQTYQRFGRSVSCQYQSQTIAALNCTEQGLQITVTVTDPNGKQWRLTRFVPAHARSLGASASTSGGGG